MSVKRHILANYLGSAWVGIIQIAFVPLYIKYLGIEAFGLIGVYASLQVLLSLLNIGLTPTMTRELARFKAGVNSIGQVRELLRTVETIFLCIGLLLVMSIFAVAPWIARDWLVLRSLPEDSVIAAVRVMGAIVAIRFVSSLYRGVLTGMQELTWLNLSSAFFATIQAAGVLLVLIWIAPTIDAFFIFQGSIALVELFVMFRKSWRLLLFPAGAHFSIAALRSIWRFSSGLAIISFFALLLMQTDKVLLSRMLPLSEFGCYSLASMLAGSLGLLVLPIASVAYPRLSELAALGDRPRLVEAYRQFSQWMTLIVVPFAMVLAIFSEFILSLWVRDPLVVGATAPLLTLLTVGYALNGLMSIPSNLQVALGHSRSLVMSYGVILLVFVPALYFGVSSFGVFAAGYVWIAMNAACLLVAVLLMHRSFLRIRDKLRWYWSDVVQPAGAVFLAVHVAHLMAPRAATDAPLADALVVLGALVFAFAGALLASSSGRGLIAHGLAYFEKPGA